LPAIAAFSITNVLLFASPLTIKTATYCFTSLLVSLFVTIRFDHWCVRKEMAPLWFKGYRSTVLGLYMALTSILFFIYYSHIDKLQRTNDPNRISTLKSSLELEDVDFIKMVDEMNIKLNDVDLKEVE
jgi:hypothetical protein